MGVHPFGKKPQFWCSDCGWRHNELNLNFQVLKLDILGSNIWIKQFCASKNINKNKKKKKKNNNHNNNNNNNNNNNQKGDTVTLGKVWCTWSSQTVKSNKFSGANNFLHHHPPPKKTNTVPADVSLSLSYNICYKSHRLYHFANQSNLSPERQREPLSSKGVFTSHVTHISITVNDWHKLLGTCDLKQKNICFFLTKQKLTQPKDHEIKVYINGLFFL